MSKGENPPLNYVIWVYSREQGPTIFVDNFWHSYLIFVTNNENSWLCKKKLATFNKRYQDAGCWCLGTILLYVYVIFWYNHFKIAPKSAKIPHKPNLLRIRSFVMTILRSRFSSDSESNDLLTKPIPIHITNLYLPFPKRGKGKILQILNTTLQIQKTSVLVRYYATPVKDPLY